MAEDLISVGLYWDIVAWHQGRSAYVADLDDDPSCPDSFAGWLNQALEQHVARGPKARAERAASLAPTSREDRAHGINRHHRLRASTLEAVESALTADRRVANRIISRSEFLVEAVLAAANHTRHRRGGELPPAPDGLPRGRPRRRTSGTASS